MNRDNLQQAMPAAGVASRMRRAFDLGEAASEISEARRLLPAWCFVAFSALCVGVLLFASALSSGGCRVEPIPRMLGVDSEISIGLPAGTACTILVPTGSMVVEDVTIGVPPKRGALMLRGRTGVIYRPDPGFKGEDAFAFSLGGRSGSTRGTSTIRVRARIG